MRSRGSSLTAFDLPKNFKVARKREKRRSRKTRVFQARHLSRANSEIEELEIPASYYPTCCANLN